MLTEVGFGDVTHVCVQTVDHVLAPGVLGKEPQGSKEGVGQPQGPRARTQRPGMELEAPQARAQAQDLAEGDGDVLGSTWQSKPRSHWWYLQM